MRCEQKGASNSIHPEQYKSRHFKTSRKSTECTWNVSMNHALFFRASTANPLPQISSYFTMQWRRPRVGLCSSACTGSTLKW